MLEEKSSRKLLKVGRLTNFDVLANIDKEGHQATHFKHSHSKCILFYIYIHSKFFIYIV